MSPRQDHQDPPGSSRRKQFRLSEWLKPKQYSAARSAYLPCDCKNLPCQSVLEEDSDSPKAPFVPGGPQFICEGGKFSLQRISGASPNAFGLDSLMFRPCSRHKNTLVANDGPPPPSVHVALFSLMLPFFLSPVLLWT